MFDDLLVPLLLSKHLGKVKGKTRFQKIVFLIQKEAETRRIQASSFGYEIHHYGPYSAELSVTLEKLQSDHLLEEETEMTPSGYIRYVYSITEKGQKLLSDAQKKGLVSPELERIIKKVIEEYGEKQLSDLVSDAYGKYLE
jgi:uncharacterized protein YwgA